MIEIIEKIVLDARNANYLAVHSKSRKEELKEVRQIVMYFTRDKYPNKTFAEIAGYYGLDHATCMHSIKVINNLIDTNVEFKEDMNYIRLEIDLALSDRVLDRLIIERNSIARVIEKYQIKLAGLNDIINKLESKEIEPKTVIPLRNDFKSPFRELESANNKPYSGFRTHQL